ncbi:MAG: amino acid transporter substrate-binding protein family [Marmoricola sp.]|nr:amino acid transporter substrate-binding protein family [Marmoricola sp.]
MRLKPLVLLVLPLLVATTACGPKDESGSAGRPTSSTSSSAASCTKTDLPLKTGGKLTVATDTPAYDPWFSGNDPTNGKGFESAVAYAVTDRLGFDGSEVAWVKEPFNNSYAPGAKRFDFDINQISITPARAKVVDFSRGYYSAAQAVIALKKENLSPGALADLADLKLGAQTGTTSLTAIRDVIRPSQQPLVFNNTNTAKQALLNGQVDAIVADLPTAFYVTGAEIKGSTIVGQFQPVSGQKEEFGLLMEKGSGLRPCVDKAIASLAQDGTLASLEKQWLSDTVDVPVLK